MGAKASPSHRVYDGLATRATSRHERRVGHRHRVAARLRAQPGARGQRRGHLGAEARDDGEDDLRGVRRVVADAVVDAAAVVVELEAPVGARAAGRGRQAGPPSGQ